MYKRKIIKRTSENHKENIIEIKGSFVLRNGTGIK